MALFSATSLKGGCRCLIGRFASFRRGFLLVQLADAPIGEWYSSQKGFFERRESGQPEGEVGERTEDGKRGSRIRLPPREGVFAQAMEVRLSQKSASS